MFSYSTHFSFIFFLSIFCVNIPLVQVKLCLFGKTDLLLFSRVKKTSLEHRLQSSRLRSICRLLIMFNHCHLVYEYVKNVNYQENIKFLSPFFNFFFNIIANCDLLDYGYNQFFSHSFSFVSMEKLFSHYFNGLHRVKVKLTFLKCIH